MISEYARPTTTAYTFAQIVICMEASQMLPVVILAKSIDDPKGNLGALSPPGRRVKLAERPADLR